MVLFKWSKQVFVICLVFAMIVGCSSASNTEETNEDTGAQSQETTEEAKTPVEISLLIAESLLGGIHNDLVAEFQAQHPEIIVNVETLPDGGYFDAVRTRVTTGEVPDLYQINIGHVTTALADEAGYIYDLKDMESIQNYASSIREASKINGKIANFSLGVGVLGFPYNKQALAELGYTKPFESWEEMMAAGEKMKSQGKDLLVYASKWETAIGIVFHWTFGNLALKDADFKKAYLSNSIDWSNATYRAALEEGFNKFKELNQYVRTGSFTNEYAVAQQAFANGETPMVLGGTWEAGAIRKLNANLDLGFMNLPYAAGNENPYIFVPEDGVAVNAKSENLDAAKTFANWLFSKETYAKLQKAKGSFSALTGVGELDPAYTDVPNWLNTDRVISFANTGPVPSPTFLTLGQAAQQYTFDNDLNRAVETFIEAYNKTKNQ
jgi:ABC-type glycerol-3-phosphate transport system substrate-binding protein